MGNHAEKHKHLDKARRALNRAAEALGDVPTPETLAFALVEATVGIAEIAKADSDHRAQERVLVKLAGAMAAAR